MKFTKFIVLAGGLIGLLAFFLPLIAVKDSGVTGALSAYRIVKGIDSAQQVIEHADTAAVDAYDKSEAFAASKADANQALGEVKGVVLAIFAPALLLTLIGGVAVMRKKFGRLGGVGALLFGAIGLGIWAILNAAASEVEATGGSDVKGIGMWLLMLTGLCGLVAGIMTLVKPDRGPAAAPAHAPARAA
jgi:hypothetical protein